MTEKKRFNTFLSNEAHYEELAANLHDGISQQLVAILWKIEELKLLAKGESLDAGLSLVADQLREVINDLQRIVYGLRPVLIDQLGLQEALAVWVSKHLELKQIGFEFKRYPKPLDLPRFASGQIFRIIQEGVNNIISHALASKVNLVIEREGDNLIISLSDDGRGFKSSTADAGLGLQLIQERVAMLDGEVKINSFLGGGTTLKISIPYKGDDEDEY